MRNLLVRRYAAVSLPPCSSRPHGSAIGRSRSVSVPERAIAKGWWTRRWRLWVALASLVAALASFALGWGRSLWFDEGFTTLMLDQPLGRMMHWLVLDVHPPLYYLLLRGWTVVFGMSAAALRAFGCVLTGLTVAVMAALLRLIAGRRLALASLPFVVFAPLALRYGYEIRMYALMPLIAVAATYALLRALKAGDEDGRSRRLWWLAYAVLVAAGMYAQYLMAVVWVSHVIWLGWLTLRSRRSTNHLGWRWIWAYVLSVGLYLPWLPFAIRQMLTGGLPGLTGTMNPATLASVGTIMVFGLNVERVDAVLTVPLLVGAALLIAAGIKLHDARLSGGCRDAERNGEARHLAGFRTPTGLLAYLFICPMCLFLAGAAVQEGVSEYGFFTIRYVCAFAPFAYASLGLLCATAALGKGEGGDGAVCAVSESGEHETVCVTSLKPTPASGFGMRFLSWAHRWAAYAATLALLLAGSAGYAVQGNYIYEQARVPHAAQAAALAPCSADKPVVAADPFTYIDSYYYYRGCAHYYLLDSGTIGTHGGYAPLAETAQRIPSLDDLSDPETVGSAVPESFVLLTGSLSPDIPEQTSRWRQTSVTRIGDLRHRTYTRR